MSQQEEAPVVNDAPAGDFHEPESVNFTLQVVSPSVGVASPLSFPQIPAKTTVKQLKLKIRDILPSNPADENQRLIHRGRMLGRESETMLDIFGQETIGSPEPQTLHLVLRPTASEGPSTAPRFPTPIVAPQPALPLSTPPPFQSRPHSTPANPALGIHGQQLSPSFHTIQQHQLHHQAEHLQNVMQTRLHHLQLETQRLQQEMAMIEQRHRAHANPGAFMNGPLQPGLAQSLVNGLPHGIRSTTPIPMPASVQNLLAQQQTERASDGRRGAQDSVNTRTGVAGLNSSGRSSPAFRPDNHTTYTREGIGPGGERWQVTVNETTTILPTPRPALQNHGAQQGFPAPDIASAMRTADGTPQNPFPGMTAELEALARQTRAGNINSLSAAGTSSDGSIPTATNDRVVSATNGIPMPQVTQNTGNGYIPSSNNAVLTRTSGDPVVYILTSPVGPRAILLTNAETFYAPQSLRNPRHVSPSDMASDMHQQPRVPGGLPHFRNRHVGRAGRRNERQERENFPIPAGDAQPQNPNHENGANVMNGHAHANPNAGAVGAQMGNMLWLIVRLAGFVWFLTSGNQSWARRLMVIGIAVIIFIVNTGVFNGIAEQVWGPIRRHLETMIPLAPTPPAGGPLQGPAPPPHPDEPLREGPHGELDPEQVAARLLRRRRQRNDGRIMAQLRRAEHSFLLFLASLVPGVGERHIAAREAENAMAEAERQRQAGGSAMAEQTETNREGDNGDGAQARDEAGHPAGHLADQENQPRNVAIDAAAQAPPLVEV